MSIDDLEVLIGSWRLTGRSMDATDDDIGGDLAVRRGVDGILEARGTMRVGTTSFETLEVIWADPERGDFGAHVYSGDGPPLDYRWSIAGATLTHAGLGATYTGSISDDGTTIAGGWRPDPGQAATGANTYDATMHRVG